MCIDEVFTIEKVLTIAGITAEANTGGRSFAHVAEHHSLHVHRGAPFVGNAFHLAVEDGAVVHPRAEHCTHSSPKLLFGIGGEVVPRLFFDSLLEALHKSLEVFDRKFLIELHPAGFFHFFDDGLEGIDIFLVFGLHPEHYIAIHLHEAAVRVVNEMRIVGLFNQTFGHLIVQTEVEDGVHHAGHRGTSPRAYGDEERIFGIAKFAAHGFFGLGDGGIDLCLQFGNDALLADAVVVVAGVGGDGETRRYRYPNLIHLSEVGTFAAEEFSHCSISFGLSITEGVNSFYFFHLTYDVF